MTHRLAPLSGVILIAAPIAAQQPASGVVRRDALLTQPPWAALWRRRASQTTCCWQRVPADGRRTRHDRRVDDADRARLATEKTQTDSTIDNGATTTEIQALAMVFAAPGALSATARFAGALDYILARNR